MRLNSTFTCSEFLYFKFKIIFDPKIRIYLQKIGNYPNNVKISSIFSFLRVKNDFEFKIKKIRNM